jgi:hypothetical protein
MMEVVDSWCVYCRCFHPSQVLERDAEGFIMSVAWLVPHEYDQAPLLELLEHETWPRGADWAAQRSSGEMAMTWMLECPVCHEDMVIPPDREPPDELQPDRVVLGMAVPQHEDLTKPGEMCAGSGHVVDPKRVEG